MACPRPTSGLELTPGSLGVWLERERSCALVIASFRDEQPADAVAVAH